MLHGWHVVKSPTRSIGHWLPLSLIYWQNWIKLSLFSNGIVSKGADFPLLPYSPLSLLVPSIFLPLLFIHGLGEPIACSRVGGVGVGGGGLSPFVSLGNVNNRHFGFIHDRNQESNLVVNRDVKVYVMSVLSAVAAPKPWFLDCLLVPLLGRTSLSSFVFI